MRITSFVLLFVAAVACAATDKSFGEYYPYTRWVEPEHHLLVVDAFPDRIVISQRGKQAIIVHGCWQGRAFLRECRTDYFGVAYEGRDGAFFGDPRLERFTLRRVHPDPKTQPSDAANRGPSLCLALKACERHF